MAELTVTLGSTSLGTSPPLQADRIIAIAKAGTKIEMYLKTRPGQRTGEHAPEGRSHMNEVRQYRHHLWTTISHVLLGLCTTPHAPCDITSLASWRPCLLYADSGVHSDAMANSRLQGGDSGPHRKKMYNEMFGGVHFHPGNEEKARARPHEAEEIKKAMHEFIKQSHADMHSHVFDFYSSLSIPWVMKRFHPLRYIDVDIMLTHLSPLASVKRRRRRVAWSAPRCSMLALMGVRSALVCPNWGRVVP